MSDNEELKPVIKKDKDSLHKLAQAKRDRDNRQKPQGRESGQTHVNKIESGS